MRDLLFKNLTSSDRKRKVIASSEVIDKQGVRSIIHRHFICMVKEVNAQEVKKPLPYLYVLKEKNTKEHKEKFYCRIKGSVLAVNSDKLYLIVFTHSLRIHLEAIPQEAV